MVWGDSVADNKRGVMETEGKSPGVGSWTLEDIGKIEQGGGSTRSASGPAPLIDDFVVLHEAANRPSCVARTVRWDLKARRGL